MRARVLTAVVGVALLLSGGAHAQQVFKCTDRLGRVTYSNSACPTDSAKAHDITSAVQACVDEECERRQRRELDLARQRLQEDKQALAEMSSQRRKAEAEYLEKMARLEEIKARAAAARTIPDEPYYDRWGYYPWVVPGYPVVRPPARPPIAKPHHPARLDPMYTSPPVPLQAK